jgi:hypothetical protein
VGLLEEKSMKKFSGMLAWVIGLVLIIGLASGCAEHEKASTPTTMPAAAESSLFEEGGFSFLYPSNWQMMTEEDIDELCNVELKGLQRQYVIWMGGVFTGHVDPSNHPNSASIFILTAKASGIAGPMSEADFDQVFNEVKASFEQTVGDRLLSIRKRTVAGFQAIEIEQIGKSRRQILYNRQIFAKADHLYLVNCGASYDSYDSFKPIFDKAIASLQIVSEPKPSSPPPPGVEEEATVVAPRLQNPVTLDGEISGSEWDDAGQLSVTFVYAPGGPSITYPGTIYFKHDGTCLWICIRVQDDDENAFPETDDYAAILFDANGDGDIGSGDDSAIIHHGLHGFLADLRPDEQGIWRADNDTEFSGNNDVAAESRWAAGWYIYEMCKPLNSGDSNGCDIAISPGDTILASSCISDAGEGAEWAADAGSFYIELEP